MAEPPSRQSPTHQQQQQVDPLLQEREEFKAALLAQRFQHLMASRQSGVIHPHQSLHTQAPKPSTREFDRFQGQPAAKHRQWRPKTPSPVTAHKPLNFLAENSIDPRASQPQSTPSMAPNLHFDAVDAARKVTRTWEWACVWKPLMHCAKHRGCCKVESCQLLHVNRDTCSCDRAQ